MDVRPIILAQYDAALEMLKQAILACPAPRWQSPDDRTPFWQVAYHALFFTHMYLQTSEQTFRPWSGHRDEYRFEREEQPPVAAPPKELVLEYLAFCRQQARANLADLVLDAESGFGWLRFSKFELQLYSIRHIQQHVGELMERLGPEAGGALDWIGTARVDAGASDPAQARG